MHCIYVFHNQMIMAMFRGLQQGDEMKLVHRTETTRQFASEAHMLRTVFSWYNHYSGTAIPSYEDRSLSVGDVITFLDSKTQAMTSFAVATSGWLKLPQPVKDCGPYGYYRSREGGFGAGPKPQART
jgi:hypothetical protein